MSATPAFRTETNSAAPEPAQAPDLRAGPWTASDFVAQPPPSPARELQHELARRLQAGEAPRWSRRRTALFVLVTCGTFWAVTAAVVARLLH